jgi:general secretion pathway protein D
VLTPYVIREQADLRTIFERKMQERQEFLDHYFVFAEQNDYEAPKDYSRTTGLLEDIRQSFTEAEDQRRLEELQRPRELKTHTPGRPLQLPGRAGAAVSEGRPAEEGGVPPTSGGDK